MKEFIFKNLESKVDIKIPLDKTITYIYGGNGMGKTTFSRAFALNVPKSKVFNVDFINKNVYIVDSDGAKSNPTNKENFSKLFVSEEAVRLAALMVKTKDINKQLEPIKTQKQTEISSRISTYKINSNIDLDLISGKLDFSDSQFDYLKTIDENKLEFKYKSKLKTIITNENELKSRVKQYSSYEQFNRINNLLNSNHILKSIFISKTYIAELNSLLEIYNLTIEHIAMQEEKFRGLGETERVKTWITEGISLHHNKTKCIFCGSDDVCSSIDEWIKIIKGKFLEDKKRLLNIVQNTLSTLDTELLSKKEIYQDLIPLIYKTSEILFRNHKTLEDLLNRTEKVESVNLNIEIDNTTIKAEELHCEIVNYLINEKFDDYLFPYAYSIYLKKKQNEFEMKANDESKKFAESTKNIIEDIAKKLGLEKELNVLSEVRRGSIPKLSITPAESSLKIGSFSEGQRHKLALAIFFAELLLRDDIPEFLVLDDPMISLDVVAYHKLKRFIVFDLNKKYENLIILTHNISFLLIMLSNLFRNSDLKDKSKLLELRPKTCDEIQLDIIAKDDIVLFKHAVINSNTIDDITLWYWMIDKISRCFLDLKLSIKGKVTFNGVSDDLLAAFDSENFKEGKRLNKKITKVAKSRHTTIRNIISALEALNDFIKLLGFPVLFDNKTMNEFKEKFNLNLSTIDNPTARNFEFSVLKEGYSVAFDVSKENSLLKDYIMHPRHQITESLIAYEAQKDG